MWVFQLKWNKQFFRQTLFLSLNEMYGKQMMLMMMTNVDIVVDDDGQQLAPVFLSVYLAKFINKINNNFYF